MKFSCYKKDLTEALQFVTKAVAVKPMTPVLSGVYIKANDFLLEVQANNCSTGIAAKIPVSTDIGGETVVSGKRLLEFVRNMPDDTISFSDTDNNSLKIESGGAAVELLTMNVADFPNVKPHDSGTDFRIGKDVLRDLIRKTIFATAKDISRPVFTGCSFEIDGNKLSLVATNTHRLAKASDTMIDTRDAGSFVVPAETLRTLLARLDVMDDDRPVVMNFSPCYLSILFDNFFMTSRIIEGQFPSYDKIFPESSATHVTVDTIAFRKAIEFVSLMSKETEYNTVKLTFSDGGIEISSTSPDIGGAAKFVDAQVDGDQLDIHFNVQYILDVLRVIDTKETHIALNDRFKPAVFTEPDNKDFIYVVTPTRV